MWFAVIEIRLLTIATMEQNAKLLLTLKNFAIFLSSSSRRIFYCNNNSNSNNNNKEKLPSVHTDAQQQMYYADASTDGHTMMFTLAPLVNSIQP